MPLNEAPPPAPRPAPEERPMVPALEAPPSGRNARPRDADSEANARCECWRAVRRCTEVSSANARAPRVETKAAAGVRDGRSKGCTCESGHAIVSVKKAWAQEGLRCSALTHEHNQQATLFQHTQCLDALLATA
jgi:hypothetical protein